MSTTADRPDGAHDASENPGDPEGPHAPDGISVDDGIRTRTVDYYRFLLEAEQTVREVAYDGAIF